MSSFHSGRAFDKPRLNYSALDMQAVGASLLIKVSLQWLSYPDMASSNAWHLPSCCSLDVAKEVVKNRIWYPCYALDHDNRKKEQFATPTQAVEPNYIRWYLKAKARPAPAGFPPLLLFHKRSDASCSSFERSQYSLNHRRPMTLISSVHTRLIHTLSFPSTPSTLSSSTPSHQHLLAGLRQNSNSFCAMPTALLPISLPRMSLRSLARARLQTTALLGSPARCPHWSS